MAMIGPRLGLHGVGREPRGAAGGGAAGVAVPRPARRQPDPGAGRVAGRGDGRAARRRPGQRVHHGAARRRLRLRLRRLDAGVRLVGDRAHAHRVPAHHGAGAGRQRSHHLHHAALPPHAVHHQRVPVVARLGRPAAHRRLHPRQAGQADVLHLERGLLHVQGGALHAERVRHVLRVHAHGHEHREVLRHHPPDEGQVPVLAVPGEEDLRRHLAGRLRHGHAHPADHRLQGGGRQVLGHVVRARLRGRLHPALQRRVLAGGDPGGAHRHHGLHVLRHLLGGVARHAAALPDDQRQGPQRGGEHPAVQEAAGGLPGVAQEERGADPHGGGDADREAGDQDAGGRGGGVRHLLGAAAGGQPADGLRRAAARLRARRRPQGLQVHECVLPPAVLLQQLREPDRVRLHVAEFPRELPAGAVPLLQDGQEGEPAAVQQHAHHVAAHQRHQLQWRGPLRVGLLMARRAPGHELGALEESGPVPVLRPPRRQRRQRLQGALRRAQQPAPRELPPGAGGTALPRGT